MRDEDVLFEAWCDRKGDEEAGKGGEKMLFGMGRIREGEQEIWLQPTS